MPTRHTVPQSALDFLHSLGLEVYMRNRDDSYLIFSDGKRLGYLEHHAFNGFTLTSVHVPNSTTGTGFQVARHAPSVDEPQLRRCLTLTEPGWLPSRDRGKTVKYRSPESYFSASSFNRQYKPIPRS